LIDSSHGLVTIDNFRKEELSIANILVANWNVSRAGMEANPILYDAVELYSLGNFNFENNDELQTVLRNLNGTVGFYDNAPGIAA
jgi:hypothetical protein